MHEETEGRRVYWGIPSALPRAAEVRHALMQFLLNILMLGGVYGIIAAGFSLVYGVMNVLNVAHGAFAMLGAYLTYSVATGLGWNPLVGVPIALIALFGFGFVLQRYVLSLLSEASIFMIFIFTFGLQMALQNTAVLVWDPIYRAVPSPTSDQVVALFGGLVSVDRVIVFAFAWLFAGGLFYLLVRTRLGLAIQSTALDSDSARLAGVDVRYIYAMTFGIAAALAGAAGALLSTLQPVYPFMDVALIGKAFAVAVLGGLGSVPGALVGGLLLAATEQSVSRLAGIQYAQIVAYATLVVVLLIRARGLFGREYFAEVKL